MSRRGGAGAAVKHGVWTGVGTALGGLLVLLVLLWLFGEPDDDDGTNGGAFGTLGASSSGGSADCGWL